ncbi:hypothetical protein C8J57DRAFT_1528772 [Mycena rebaudengoi]|nr:hypothetical protein C8J57DRAFT_1528772 [Mycena rebaudengoi]
MLNPEQVRKAKERQAQEEEDRRVELSETRHRTEQALQDQGVVDHDEGGGHDDEWEDIAQGNTTADHSHAGHIPSEEVDHDKGGGHDNDHAGHIPSEDDIEEANKSLLEKLHENHESLYPRYADHRTCRDRTQILVDAFALQLNAMADAYLQWTLTTASQGLATDYVAPVDAILDGSQHVLVVDMYSAYFAEIPLLVGDELIASAYVRQGLMPCSPYFPTVVITTRVLEVFRVAHLRCPRFSIQPFVRTLCDLHGVLHRLYLSTQFSTAFDIYLSLCAIIDKRVLRWLQWLLRKLSITNLSHPLMDLKLILWHPTHPSTPP